MTRASGVCELVYRCRRTRIPVSVNSYTGVVNSYTGVCEIVYCPYILWGTRLPVSANSYTGVCCFVLFCSYICIYKGYVTRSSERASARAKRAKIQLGEIAWSVCSQTREKPRAYTFECTFKNIYYKSSVRIKTKWSKSKSIILSKILQ